MNCSYLKELVITGAEKDITYSRGGQGRGVWLSVRAHWPGQGQPPDEEGQ